MDDPSANNIPKTPSLIEGLDQILQGGLPSGRTSLIVGGPGTGKSLFGLEFLYRNALAGTPGIFVSFEEHAAPLRVNAMTLGWDLAALEKSGKLFLFEARIDPRAIVTGEFGIQGFMSILERKLHAMGAKLAVIDALDVLLRLIRDEQRAQNEMLALHQWLAEHGITTLLTTKAPHEAAQLRKHDFMDYMADCVIDIDNRTLGQLTTRRLRVIKYRGSGFGSNEYPFVITPPGIVLLPISDVELSHLPLGEKFSTGVAGLDALLEGGFRRGASILLSGGSGSGKTTLCSSFVRAACAHGDTVLYISFEESELSLIATMLSPGIDLRPAVAAGNLHFLTAMPEAMGAEQHLVRALAMIKAVKPAHVVLEAASACKRMGTEQAAFEYLMRLINTCKEKGITVLASNQTAGLKNEDEISGIGVSSIIDAIVLLRQTEKDDCLKRELLILKARGSAHSNRCHDFVITDRGIDVKLERRPA